MTNDIMKDEHPQSGKKNVILDNLKWFKTVYFKIPKDMVKGDTLEWDAADWYNEHRPHTTLRGKTPTEVYYQLPGTNRAFRFESRPRWPARSSCASPQAPIHGKRGIRLHLHVTYLAGRKYLPIVKLRVAA